ncbi:TetR/AcrR family transcriptional regulator [Pediococcus pentosaceus]|uniref:TetR/AcrR family transcriptional regulator n=1 Tax=Pediococcus pentosaceus TaxID=1255 RepID=A0AB73HEW7_PEDPE|nr:TetR/AcrR family transcriptional regulator [Pediococcus pentosaceus]MBF7114761.1 TetR/AcrR family transcriptional regulator [Pediococcus pentosaceus]MCM6792568.1 TetR/AcrR family transcriptional regulator [Pediococcus pentosaceus]MCM6809865.1 TetR/AcrR family transcriptional regulator [Pediococcus pentosaceus]MCM6818270.1 TetR/AcrR family transcriptional regulator [Pediococcus pentosaceus]
MARNKYPEQSREKILDVAQKLFLEKGYEQTTIQKIVDDLNGMTKGVIYHHFKSKKDIWNAVMARMAGDSTQQCWFENWPGKTGLEKLQRALLRSLSEFQRYDVAYSAEVMLKDPKTIGELFLKNLAEGTDGIEGYVIEGMQDGSIETEDAHELAEFIITSINLWIGIRFTSLKREQIINKFELLKRVYDGIDVPLINNEIIDMAVRLYDNLQIVQKKF